MAKRAYAYVKQDKESAVYVKMNETKKRKLEKLKNRPTRKDKFRSVDLFGISVMELIKKIKTLDQVLNPEVRLMSE